MASCGIWIGCLFAAGAGMAQAQAQAPALFGVEFEPPSGAVIERREDRRSGGRTVTVAQSHRLRLADPAGGEARELVLSVFYTAPQGLSNSAMQEAFDANAAESSAKPGTRGTARFDIDGFPFHFIDGPADGGDYPQRMSIAGIVNGALLRFTAFAKDPALLTPELAARLKATKLRYTDLLRAKADFEAESKLAVQDDTLDTPLSRVELGRGVRARLVDSYVQADAAGRQMFRSRSFALFKTGFWTLQGLSLTVGCGERAAFDDEGPGRFLTLEERLRDEDADQRPKDVSASQPSTLAGLPAHAITAKGAKINPMRRTDIGRWMAEKDGSVYQMEIERFNGSPIEKELIRQLQSAEPACQLGLQFGADAGV